MKNFVLITGASAGIGKALAKEFARQGHNLFLVARSEEKLKQISRALHEEYGIDARWLSFDLLLDNAAESIFKYIEKNEINVEYLINNAGMGNACMFEASDIDRNEKIVMLNILTPMRMNRRVLKF